MTQQDKISEGGLLAHYHGQLRQKMQGKSGDFLYRGQENAAWPLQSGAAHRIRESSGTPDAQPINLESLVNYHQDLIDTVRRKEGWLPGSENGTLSDLKILAILQHKGAATCLLDFTSRFDIALWFACRGKHDEDGAVFVVDISKFTPFLYHVTAQEKEKSIEKLLEFQTRKEEKPGAESRFWHWDPGVLMERMRSQGSQFLFGPQDIPEGGFCESIVVDKNDKEKLLEELEKQRGLRTDTVFADIDGFANANARTVPLDPPAASFYHGNTKYEQGDFDGAIADYDKSIRLRRNKPNVWNNRGVAKNSIGNYDGAFSDFDEAIRLQPDDAEFWNNRGNVKLTQGNIDGAIADYDEAIRLQLDYEDAIRNRKIALAKKREVAKKNTPPPIS